VSLLLDTHVVLWWLADDPTLAADIKDRLDHEPGIYVSAATIWEVAIKQAIGKLPEPARLPERIQESGFRPLPISADHAIVAARLPMIHRDPFDRMLVAQAQVEELALVTRDENCRKYEVDILAVLRPREDDLTGGVFMALRRGRLRRGGRGPCRPGRPAR
jgi:PIN domain nuclease of toxin-antitoxin system